LKSVSCWDIGIWYLVVGNDVEICYLHELESKPDF
jgi:hypothetical protein